ncbi:MAG TPA: winged helix-turn-helix transcriptional regulator [Patescibacteria group bacterium]|nr:winged helix-turn-helix transcriptional regulator [Patescibacteria group bacterium]
MTPTKIKPNNTRKLTKNIDAIDREILSSLSEDPEISQTELSHRLKISQPAVSLRIRKLEEKGVLARLVGTDIKKAQLFLAKVDFTANNVPKVLESLEKCPLYLNCFLTSGRHNMTCLLIGENMRSILSCVDSRLRQNLPVENIEFDMIVTPTRPFIVPVKPKMEKKAVTPCGADCSTCTFYTSDRCLGCPASIHYKGNLL